MLNWNNVEFAEKEFLRIDSIKKIKSELKNKNYEYIFTLGSASNFYTKKKIQDFFYSNTLLINNKQNDKIISYNKLKKTIICESGISFKKLLIKISKDNFYLYGLPGYSNITLGGAINYETFGKNYNSIFNSIDELTYLDIKGKICVLKTPFNKTKRSILKSNKIYIYKVKLKLLKMNYNLKNDLKLIKEKNEFINFIRSKAKLSFIQADFKKKIIFVNNYIEDEKNFSNKFTFYNRDYLNYVYSFSKLIIPSFLIKFAIINYLKIFSYRLNFTKSKFVNLGSVTFPYDKYGKISNLVRVNEIHLKVKVTKFLDLISFINSKRIHNDFIILSNGGKITHNKKIIFFGILAVSMSNNDNEIQIFIRKLSLFLNQNKFGTINYDR